MSNKFLLLILFITFHCLALFGQDKRGYTVICGGGANYAKFDGSTNKPIGKQLYPNPTNSSEYRRFDHATSNICDSVSGNLVMLCNGMILYDTLGNIIENGDSLQPNKIYNLNCCPTTSDVVNGSLILPKGSNKEYYVFTPTISDAMYDYWITNPFGDGRGPYDILQYHIVDMNANVGLGKVVQKNIKLLENVELCKTGMMACKHANGYDWWLLKQGANTNTIYTFLVTKDSITLDTIQSFPQPIFGYYDRTGQSCFSNDGSKYAFASGGVNSGGAKLFIADFDRCYGILSNVKTIHVPYDSTLTILDAQWNAYDSLITGISFSPNDSFLYVNRRYLIYQYELNQVDSSLAWYKVKQGMDTTFFAFEQYGQLVLGVDKRIYIGKFGSNSINCSVIDKPNNKGAGCDFCRKCFSIDSSWYTLQAFANMPNFNMPPKTPCWPLNNEQLILNNEQWELYPNPVNAILYIKHAKGKKKKLYNTYGQLLISTTKEEIDISGLAKGLYYLSCGQQTQKVLVE